MRPAVYSRTRWFLTQDGSSPIYWLTLLLHLFNKSLYLLILFVAHIHNEKNCGQLVRLPVTLLLCLKTHLAFSSQLENKVALLVQVCKFL